MDTSWWRTAEDLDKAQKAFVMLPPSGKHLLQGPPGSGKTNMLLLRAQFIAGSGFKNVLVISFTKALAGFMKSGVERKGIIQKEQVRTFHSWAAEYILEHLGERLIDKGSDFDEAARARTIELLRKASTKAASTSPYDGIFVDEAQDFTVAELECLIPLSERICLCGDVRQGIYNNDGLEVATKFGLTSVTLENHYRIGPRIAQVADRIIPPSSGEKSLEDTSNYDQKRWGESSAKMHPCDSRDDQFHKMMELIEVQLDAFKGDLIGVLCGKRETALDVMQRLEASKHKDNVCLHLNSDGSFNSEKVIHILTLHSSKGTEFRAVHIFGAEEMASYPLNRTKLAYTAVTRAKTALNVYRTGPTRPAFEAAFATPAHLELEDLF